MPVAFADLKVKNARSLLPMISSLKTVMKGVEKCTVFQPDMIIAFRGGSPMDAAKIMRVMYEHPEVRFEDLAMRFTKKTNRSHIKIKNK